MGIFNLFNSKKKLVEIDQFSSQDSVLFQSQYKTPRVPVLLKGAAKHWPLHSKWSKDYIKDNMADFYNATLGNIPLGKFGAGEDIAKSVAFLASPASGHTTGTNVVIDGGFTKGVQF